MPMIKKMTDLNLKGKRVLIREDLNVPIENGKITSDKRIRAAVPTIEKAMKAKAKVMVISHLGRPEEGKFTAEYSLAPVAKMLSKILGKNVSLMKGWLNGVDVAEGDVVLCENVRFNKGESKNDEELAKKMAELCDIFVMDAFATAHRAQASTYGIAEFAPIACAGPLLIRELDALSRIIQNPAHPLLAIVGGAKLSTKLSVLENLLDKVDQLIVGGGIGNIFIAASGFKVGKSLYEQDLLPQAKNLMTLAKKKGAEIPLPSDVITAKELSKKAKAVVKQLNEVTDDDMILDIGPKTCQSFMAFIAQARTILWNGPLGVFEYNQFAGGTKAVAKAVAQSDAFSVAGGGDTVAAIEKYHVDKRISYVSTAGGAFLEFIEGKRLPGIAILEERAG
ncbi:MAG: phosphoglycerate kinase [Coxiella sp. DG_40]|nr:MAG: phosphoglycerate kinase [Coxiella sp. DG_40]